jgi:RNA-directed DNA polymerase
MCLIRRWLRAPLEKDGKLIKRRIGIPQGSPISPLLANIVLHELDIEMEKRNLRFVRYADDFSIYCKTKAEARKTGNAIYIFLRDKLKLPINKAKSGIRRPVHFQILGFSFVPIYKKGVKGKYQLVITASKWNVFKAKLKEITRKTKPKSFDQRICELNAYINGWIESRKYANIKAKLEALDSPSRTCFREVVAKSVTVLHLAPLEGYGVHKMSSEHF